jgi:hypothetical protein
MSLVFDSSASLAWIYGDEVADAIRQLFDTVADTSALVPAPWRLEVADRLTVAVHQGRIDAEFRRASLDDRVLLNLKASVHTDVHA